MRQMERKFDGVAFDVDGTLYANSQFYVRILPFLIREFPLILAWGRARNALRKSDVPVFPAGDFYEKQAALMGRYLGTEPEALRERLDALVYRGWEGIFKRVPLFPYLQDTLRYFRNSGLRLGVLSDLPPDRKLEYLGLAGIWDAQLCSELSGGLKPGKAPFLALAEKMGLPPERILYVGNSVSCDVRGSKSAGMKAALIVPSLRRGRRSGGRSGGKWAGYADFVFSSYRQLSLYVLS
jgi:putative hydrolase of the HAD superfamily